MIMGIEIKLQGEILTTLIKQATFSKAKNIKNQ